MVREDQERRLWPRQQAPLRKAFFGIRWRASKSIFGRERSLSLSRFSQKMNCDRKQLLTMPTQWDLPKKGSLGPPRHEWNKQVTTSSNYSTTSRPTSSNMRSTFFLPQKMRSSAYTSTWREKGLGGCRGYAKSWSRKHCFFASRAFHF